MNYLKGLCSLMDVLLNIHAKIKNALKYVGSNVTMFEMNVYTHKGSINEASLVCVKCCLYEDIQMNFTLNTDIHVFSMTLVLEASLALFTDLNTVSLYVEHQVIHCNGVFNLIFNLITIVLLYLYFHRASIFFNHRNTMYS